MPDKIQFVQFEDHRQSSFTLRFAGSKSADVREESATGGVANYYRGLDQSGWITNVPLYRQVRYSGMYPDIDLVFHGSAGRIEYDFQLAPNADPNHIQVHFDRRDRLDLQKDGTLLVTDGDRKLRLLAPAASQLDGTESHVIGVSYRMLGRHAVGFTVASYDHAKQLLIDPVVSYSTSLAVSNSTQVASLAADSSGDLILSASTFASNYPVVNGLPSVTNPSQQVVVTKLDPTGETILYSTYLPASNFSNAGAVAVDSAGNAYITGITGGYDFPVTSHNLGTCTNFCNAGFITKLNTSGTILYSTLLGSGQVLPKAIVVNSLGNAFVVGEADSSLQTVNAFQSTPGGAFFAKLNTGGTAYVFSSYLGNNNIASGVALDSSGNLYVAGAFTAGSQSSVPLKNAFQSNVGGLFLNKFTGDGQTLLFGSQLGGDTSASSNAESLAGIGIGADGSVYLAGSTASNGFPYTINAYRQPIGENSSTYAQMFAMALNPALTTLKYSTSLGWGYMNAMAVDAAGDLYVAGSASNDPIQAKAAVVADLTSGGEFLELDPTGNPVQISGFGGHSLSQPPSAMAIDQSGNIYLAGNPAGGAGAFAPGCAGTDPIIVGAAAYASQVALGTGCESGYNLFFAKVSPDAKPQISLGYQLPFLPLHNVGSADLHISSMVFSGGITKAQGNCAATVPAGDSCVLTLTDANGNLAPGSVAITSDASPSVQTFTPYADPSGIGTPVQDFLWADASNLFFPPQQTGTSSAPRPLQLWNVGATNLTLDAINTQGSLSQTHNCTTTLAPGSSCTIEVAWTPSGNYGTAISLTYDDGTQVSYNVPSTFLTSATPLLVSQVNPIPFGTQTVGNPSFYRTVTVTNISNSSAAAPRVSLSGDSTFSVAGNTCTAALAPQQRCVIAVLFTPVINGPGSTTLNISGGATASITLNGTGQIASAVTISPIQLQWFQVSLGTTSQQSLMLTNTSSGTIPVSSISFSDPEFTETDNCAGTLAAGATCTIQVNFQPQVAGTENATMTIDFGGQATAQSLPLQGQSVFPITLTPASVNFGTANIPGTPSQPQSVIVANDSYQSEAYTLSVTGPFTVANSCPNPMPSFWGCEVSVSFVPESSGTFSGTLSVSVPGVSLNSTTLLSGTAADIAPPAALQFIPATPCRIADTRLGSGSFGAPELSAGETREFDVPQSACNIPSTAVAYSLNVTVVPNVSLNHLTLWPTGEAQPNVSTLNSLDGRIKANAAITPAGANGGVDVYVTDATQVILDIDGYFVPASTASALAFYPVTPCRIADTRIGTGLLAGPSLPAQGSRSFPVLSSPCNLPSTAQAYSLNVTAIPNTTLDYLTSWPTGGGVPNVSTLNAPTGEITANAAIVPSGNNGEVSIFVSDAANVILDVNGYFAPPGTGGLSLYTVTPCRALDTRPIPFTGTTVVSVQGSACAPPISAEAYVLNATVVPVDDLDYLTLWPDVSALPNVSTLNALDGAITSNMAIVPTNDGAIDAFAQGTTNLILDISSYFAP